MSDLSQVFDDLAAEGDAIDALIADLAPEQWNLPTPAPGWTVANQVAHLAFIFHLAGAAAGDTEEFAAIVERASKGFDAAVNAAIDEYMDAPKELLARWRSERAATVKALSALPPDQIVPWLVRPIPAFVLACAGIMELFGHGQDIADALGVRREYTDRIQHLVGFAILVWDFGYESNGLTPPDAQFRFELTAPSGEVWAFGPEDAEQKVSGPAADFCLLVTRRRHRDDLAVVAEGADADKWLDIAQAYRGPAGEGRKPRPVQATWTADGTRDAPEVRLRGVFSRSRAGSRAYCLTLEGAAVSPAPSSSPSSPVSHSTSSRRRPCDRATDSAAASQESPTLTMSPVSWASKQRSAVYGAVR